MLIEIVTLLLMFFLLLIVPRDAIRRLWRGL
jgi:hypothetical protein